MWRTTDFRSKHTAVNLQQFVCAFSLANGDILKQKQKNIANLKAPPPAIDTRNILASKVTSEEEKAKQWG